MRSSLSLSILDSNLKNRSEANGEWRKKAKRSRDESGRNRESTHYVRAGGGGDGVKRRKRVSRTLLLLGKKKEEE